MAMMEGLAQQDIGAKSKGDLAAAIERTNAIDQVYEVRQRIMGALHIAQKTACVGPAPAGFPMWMDALIDEP
eukprot:6876453-Pyramimonas_sp.AAC.1